ncbi:Fe-S cluster assembly protein HesB [Exiguobacterium sp. s141]|uniref:Fe-S cluster assembly protein HesB n=1 Tax=Exiguobacterium sp. s141 TaxID=2751240 RepID=UPI001BEA4CFD|nr:Fe-S cluster assembly protein HesB [Exiguobacterium sp. s141]
MNITNEAIDVMKETTIEGTIGSVRIRTEAGCCGPTLGLVIATPERTDMITHVEGLTFALAADAIDLAKCVTIDIESTENEARLVLRGLKLTC